MNTEVKAKESASPESPATPAVASRAAGVQPPLWHRRRYQIAAGVVAVALIAAFVANNFLARQYSPAGAVSQYLSAIQRGDATAAWSLIEASAPTAKVDATLVDRAALQASLSSARPDFKSFAITQTANADARKAVVEFSYETARGTKQSALTVERSGATSFGFYPVWHLVITPTLLQAVLPKGSAGVTIDGKAIALPDGAKSTVAVLPLAHKIRFNGTQILETQSLTVDAFSSSELAVPYQPKLTPAGLDAVRAAIKAAFVACTKSTSFTPDGCPQRNDAYFVNSPQWQLVGDPLQDLAISFDQGLNPIGTGHFQMEIAYQGGAQGTQYDVSSGGYSAQLSLAASDVAVGSISEAHGLPALQRPAGASDQTAKDLVSKALQQCSTLRLQNPPDCPQTIIAAGASNFRWTLSGDPLASATVTFDQQSGVLTVHGTFAMSAAYDWLGNAETDRSFYSAYNALLLWDGQGLVLVTIHGTNS